jgi:hypothetical protein
MEKKRVYKHRQCAVPCLLAILACLVATPARAQLNSNTVTATLSALAPESLTVTLTTPGPVNFTLTGGSADAGSVTPAWNTTWNLKPSRNTVTVCAFLTGALAGTGGNPDTIPVANVLGQPDATGGFSAFTSTVCGQANGISVHAWSLASTGRTNITKADSVALEINDSALTLEADTYSGTLNILAQATP